MNCELISRRSGAAGYDIVNGTGEYVLFKLRYRWTRALCPMISRDLYQLIAVDHCDQHR